MFNDHLYQTMYEMDEFMMNKWMVKQAPPQSLLIRNIFAF